MKAANVLACALILFVLTACNNDLVDGKKYAVKEVGGQVYLLNESTGQLFLRDGGRLVELKRYTDADMRQLGTQKLLPIQHIKGLSVLPRIKFHNGSLMYSVEIDPWKHAKAGDKTNSIKADFVEDDPNWMDYWKKDGNNITLNFSDKDNFQLGEATLIFAGYGRSSATTIVDHDEKPTGYMYSGSLKMDPEDYQLISDVFVTWNLDKPTKVGPKSHL